MVVVTAWKCSLRSWLAYLFTLFEQLLHLVKFGGEELLGDHLVRLGLPRMRSGDCHYCNVQNSTSCQLSSHRRAIWRALATKQCAMDVNRQRTPWDGSGSRVARSSESCCAPLSNRNCYSAQTYATHAGANWRFGEPAWRIRRSCIPAFLRHLSGGISHTSAVRSHA